MTKNKLEKALKTLTRSCTRCGHAWLLRRPVEPKVCPKCKSAYWNVDRKK